MKNSIKIFLAVLGMATFFAACKKVDDLPFYDEGSPVTITASSNSVAPTRADSTNNVVSFSWSNPNYSTDSANVKYILQIDSAGRNFSNPFTKEIMGQRSTGLTGRELNAILLEYGFAIGTPYNLDVRVISSYGNNNERYTSNTVNINVTPYSDPSVLTSTATTVTGALNTASQNALTFNWTPSFPGYNGIVTYSIQYDSAGKNFASPQEIAVGASMFTKPMTQGEINNTALVEGVAGGTSGKIEYRVKATTAQGAVAYSNPVAVTINTYIPLLRFYLPGSYQSATGNGNDWDPGTAPELIRDQRTGLLNNMYYTYIYLPAGAEFKVTQGRDWNVNYGGSGGNLSAGGSNFSVATAGVYRISINVNTMKYDIRQGRMGFVGGATGAGWTPGNVFPTYAMGAPDDNLFIGITNLTADEWKLIDNDQWNNGSNSVDETRSYGTSGGSGSTLEVNGANFSAVSTQGRYRVIWDGRDPNNVKYELSPATEMRVVGDGINQAGVNDWDPGSSPQMTYMGNGVWTITLALKANKDIKFLAGNAWGAFDYEDAGAGGPAGTRKIKWEGGDNFKTPSTAGTYTITLNEYTQTMTIN